MNKCLECRNQFNVDYEVICPVCGHDHSMKVFKMNDCDWVAAKSEKQAKEFYEKETGIARNEIDEDFEGEISLERTMLLPLDDLPVEELKIPQNMKQIGGQTWVYKTFAWVIEHEKITSPCIICSTEY